jgi:type VI secretion system protein ImpA
MDIAALLTPIPGGNPAGRDTQFTGLHDSIKEARREDDPTLPRGDWVREPKRADWPAVAELAYKGLTIDTKDLQVSGWFTESMARLHGLAGLRDGLRLTRGLIENFWETLYPQIEYPESEEGAEDQPRSAGDLSARAKALEWLSWQLAVLVKRTPITNHHSGENLSYSQWEETNALHAPERLKGAEPEERLRLEKLGEQWNAAKAATKLEFFDRTASLLSECAVEVRMIDQICDERFGKQAPGLGAFKKALADVSSLVDDVIKERRPTASNGAGDITANRIAGETPAAKPAPAAGLSGDPAQWRQSAIDQMGQLAAVFREREPHNPARLLLRMAIKWAPMPLEDWLPQMIKNRDKLDAVSELLGINGESE